MLTCKHASQMISESQEHPLGIWERVSLRLHLWMCVSCRRFERQIHFLRRSLRTLASRADMDTQGPKLSTEVQDRIRKALAERDGHTH